MLLEKVRPLSILRTIAHHYTEDARDFVERFDLLWENQLHKTGRIKSFVDLLMACECVLKAHVMLGRSSDDPREVYKEIRKASHQIGPLAKAAVFLTDRSIYDELARRLDNFSVLIRYSLDAYETFFPSYIERHEAKLNYSHTIGNSPWVLEVRALIVPLLDSVSDELGGLVTDDIGAILEHERQIREFIDSVQGQRGTGGKPKKGTI